MVGMFFLLLFGLLLNFEICYLIFFLIWLLYSWSFYKRTGINSGDFLAVQLKESHKQADGSNTLIKTLQGEYLLCIRDGGGMGWKFVRTKGT